MNRTEVRNCLMSRYPSVQVAQLKQAERDGHRAGGDVLQPAD